VFVCDPEVVAERPPGAGVEQVPGTHQVQGRVGRPQAADIEDPGQAPAGHQHIAGNQIAVAHHVAGRPTR